MVSRIRAWLGFELSGRQRFQAWMAMGKVLMLMLILTSGSLNLVWIGDIP